MAWTKRKGAFDVHVYDPELKRKRYIKGPDGHRPKTEREARRLFWEATREIQERAGRPKVGMTVAEYADEWLDTHHGPGTRRPKASTYKVNRDYLKKFVAAFPDRGLGSFKRREALKWAKEHPYHAKTVSAMFNDAVDDEECLVNPFANRRHEEDRGRKDIHPLTEDEVTRLADIALELWGSDGYGLVARAWVLFGAWVGCRPGETFGVTARDLNLADGSVTIRRVKKRGKSYPTDVVVLPDAVQEAIKAMPSVAPFGPIFTTVTGRPMVGSNLRWHWRDIRKTFRASVSDERWAELIAGQAKTKSAADRFDFYVCRHFCASQIVDRGGNEFDVAAQLGNSPEVCREVYIHGYRDRVNERNRERLNRSAVVDLDALREAKGA